MQIGRIEDCSRVIGKSQGYMGLPLRDIVIHDKATGLDTPAMESAWLLTPEEIYAITQGAPIILRVLGNVHPPVLMYIGNVPE